MYKKLFAIALSLILVLGMGSFAVLADETEDTPSLDFFETFDTEASLENWTPGGNNGNRPITSIDTAVTDVPAGEDFGTGTLKFDAFTSTDNGLGLNRTVQNPEPGATYVFSAWVKNAEGGVAAIGIGGYSTAAFSTWKAGDSTTTVNAWVRLICSYTVPTDGSVTELTMVLRHDWDAATWVDNVHFYKYTGALPVVDDSENFSNGGFESVTSVQVSKTSEDSTAVKALHPIGWNFVKTSSYPSKINYSESNSEYAVVSSETARSGMYSLKMTALGNTVTYRLNKKISNPEPGATYIVTAYVKTVGATNVSGANGAAVYVHPTDSAGTSVAYNAKNEEYIKTQTAESAATGGWKRLRSFFTIPETFTQTQADNFKIFLVAHRKNADDNFVAYFDDITVEKMETPVITVLDENGMALTKIKDKSTDTIAQISLDAVNTSIDLTSAVAENYTLFYALYDTSGSVKQVSTIEMRAEEVGLPQEITQSHSSVGTQTWKQPGFVKDDFSVTIPAGHSMKVFVFDNIGTLSPLSFVAVE